MKNLFKIIIGPLLVAIVLICPLGYYFASSFVARFVLITTFLGLFLLLTIAYMKQFSTKILFPIISAISLVFALWCNNFLSPSTIETQINAEPILYALQYSSSGHILFDTPHSYFFLEPLANVFLIKICNLTPSMVAYAWFAFTVVIVAVGSLLILNLAKKRVTSYPKHTKLLEVLPPAIAVLSVSFAFSSRGGPAYMLAILLLWFIFDGHLEGKTNTIVITTLILAITLGSTVGALFLIPFFFIVAIVDKSKLVYGFIPLLYFIFPASSYTATLTGYVSQSWNSFVIYVNDIFIHQVPARTLPWVRTTSIGVADTYVESITYLSLIIVSLVVILILTFFRSGISRKNYDKNLINSSRAALACLWIFMGIAAITYLGSVAFAESSDSDIRTIAIVFITFPLIFLLISHKFIQKINKRILLAPLIILLVLASMFTIYQAYPKSVNDPINTVEDQRLDTFSTYSIGNFLYNFGNGTTVVSDYKIYIAVNPLLEYRNVTLDMLNGSTFSEGNIVAFDYNGLIYKSLYISPEIYSAVYNLTENQDVIYTSGNITAMFIK